MKEGRPVRRSCLLLFLSLMLGQVTAGTKEIFPVPLFTLSGLGNGYSTPTVTGDRIFVTGEIGGTGILFSCDLSGRLAWKASYGREWNEKFPGARSSPAVVDTLVYVSSGMGDLACFHAATGKKLWGVNLVSDLHGENPVFGYSVPPVIEGDKLYCMPGGDMNICCLDRFTGRVLWTAEGNGETPGYTSPLLIHHGQRTLLVAYSELTLMGLDAATGELLWTYGLSITGAAPCNEPVYSDGSLYITGMGNDSARLKLADDGRSVEKIWANPEFDTYFGGFVKKDHLLVGSSQRKRAYLGVDSETGRTVSTLPFKVGSTIRAGNDLVFYNQSGEVGVVETGQDRMSLVRSFRISAGTNEHFAHPVYSQGMLFIRHGDVLLAYDYRQIKSH